MTANEVNLILAHVTSSTAELATKEQVAKIGTKLDNHLSNHKSPPLITKKQWLILVGAIVAVLTPLATAFFSS